MSTVYTCESSSIIAAAETFSVIPNSLLPRLSFLSLSLLPLLLLRPPLPLLLPHRAIILPLLLRPPRRPHTQRPSNHPARNSRRLLRSFLQRDARPRSTIPPRPRSAIVCVIWEIEWGRRRRRRWGRLRRVFDERCAGTRCRQRRGFGLGVATRRLEIPAVGDGLGFRLVQGLLGDGGGQLQRRERVGYLCGALVG
jgi:hypothetical protein